MTIGYSRYVSQDIEGKPPKASDKDNLMPSLGIQTNP